MWASGFSEVGPVEEILEPFVSQECDMFCMSRSAEKPFTRDLHVDGDMTYIPIHMTMFL